MDGYPETTCLEAIYADELPAVPPLGLGGLGGPPFEAAEIDLPERSLLALYTDGLIEARDHDIEAGLTRLCRTLAQSSASLEATCDTVLEALLPADRPHDDVAHGYLIEDDRRFHLGPGAFTVAAHANKLAALSLDHRFLAELSQLLRCTVLVGVRVGDALVYADHAGQESPSLTFVARTHARRPLFTTAAGKTLLAGVPDEEMYRLLELAGAEQAGEVRQFLAELPEIRSRRLAFNRGVTFKDAFAVATPLLASDGSPTAAITSAVDPAEADRLDDAGEELKKAVAVLGPRYGLDHA
ncbi:SpoIIE family protein phosphatase [Streptomyces mirabilis]|jgi:DNA-binding IclR family transcriptional regulator|uniref:Transcriptional regulator, IclR family n=1 Tax=Streptomyces mirabilis TaxID=68239 RepID=A0A1I2VXP3_9ACTN|nr:transcriptional regulator, IclR family [Streptomyces mirabilis]